MDTLANRYAQALLSLTVEEGNLAPYLEALKILRRMSEENPQFFKIFSSAFVSSSEKYRLIDELCLPFGLLFLSSFFKVIADNKRFNDIDEICESFITMANEVENIEEGIIYSTISLSKQDIGRVSKAISAKTGRKIELKNEIDEQLIGGIKIVIRDRVYDGTLKNRLGQLHNKLLEGNVKSDENQHK